ncbi:MAG: hypothetical protein WBM13_14475 [Bacteroidia bacterium]
MNTYKVFLVIHIIAGTIGLISGTVNIIRKKGDRYHKITGLFFLYSMLTVSFSSFALSIIHPNYFLFIVGVFTLYLVSTGQRYLSLKNLANNQKPIFIDWALTLMMLLFGLVFIGLGIYYLMHQNTFGLVFIVFGTIGLVMVKTDIKNYKGKSEIKNVWLTVHIQRTIATYIAALTALLVVNFPNELLPNYLAFVPWLMPSAVITPLIFKWTKKYIILKKTM